MAVAGFAGGDFEGRRRVDPSSWEPLRVVFRSLFGFNFAFVFAVFCGWLCLLKAFCLLGLCVIGGLKNKLVG